MKISLSSDYDLNKEPVTDYNCHCYFVTGYHTTLYDTTTYQVTLYTSVHNISGRHFASASDLLALTVALARILALKR